MIAAHLFLHDDNAPDVINDRIISIKNDDDAPAKLRGRSIWRITNKSKGWIEPELHQAMIHQSREFTGFVKQTLLNLSAFRGWEKHPELLKVTIAHECMYVTFTRPADMPRITIRPSEITMEWPNLVNKMQNVFELGRTGHILSGDPDGGTIQIPYSPIPDTLRKA